MLTVPVLLSCGGGSPKVSHNTPDPVIESFEADYTLVTAGTEVLLTPKFPEGAGQILVDGKPLEFDGSKTVVSGKPLTVRPTASTTYTLSVSNMAGKPITKEKRIDVVEAPVISAPSLFTTGESYKASIPEMPGCDYRWGITNGTIDQGSVTREVAFKAGAVGILGLECRITRPGKENLGAKIELPVLERPVITKFIAEPSVITVGDSTTLHYEFTGGKGAITDPSLEGLKTGDSHTLWPSLGTTKYELTVTNAAGTPKSQTCSVRVVPPPTLEVTSVGKTVHFDPREGVKLKVNFTNGTCVLRPGDQQLKSGEITLKPLHPMRYEISVTNEAGSAVTQCVPVYPAQLIAAGKDHSLARAKDGGVLAWGRDQLGQLGNGRTVEATPDENGNQCAIIPASVMMANTANAPMPLKNATSVWAGAYYSLALCDGELWGWGSNYQGHLGNGTANSCGSIAQKFIKPESMKEIISVAPGWGHVLVLGNDGLYSCGWDYKDKGVLGYPGATSTLKKVDLSEVVAISAGAFHSLALTKNGKVWTWGTYVYEPDNSNDLVGLDHAKPTQIPGLENIVAISSGNMAAFALKNDGTLWAWGRNASALGNGGSANCITPTQVVTIHDAIALLSHYGHTFAKRQDETLWGWGYNTCDQINDTHTDVLSPVQIAAFQDSASSDPADAPGDEPIVASEDDEVVAIALGSAHSVALKRDGTVWNWGNIEYGQAGNKFWPSVVTRLSKDAFKDKGRISGQCTLK